MTVDIQLDISGITQSDFYNLKVSKTISESNPSSNFNVTFENIAGRHSTDFTVGDDIDIWAGIDIGSSTTTKIFTGILEDIKFTGKDVNEKVNLKGRDFTARLQDRTVEPEVYTSLPAGSIVKDIIAKYTDDITVTNVDDSPTTIPRIAFNHTPVYDAIKELADLAGYTFFVDTNKDLNFKEKSVTSSNLIFTSGNVIRANFKEERDTVFNEVWVYGDRYLDGVREIIPTAGLTNGSVATLTSKPFNTRVTTSSFAGSPLVGGILNMGLLSGVNGTEYLVNFDDREIIFVSGTDVGIDRTPITNGSTVIDYDRSLPIVKVGKDNVSIGIYGKRILKITDTEIKDPDSAVDLVTLKLSEFSIPEKEGNLILKGIIDVTPSETCVVDFPWHNVNNQTYDIIEARYNFSKINNLEETPLKITVNKKSLDAADRIKNLDIRIRKLESQGIDNTDILTRLEFTTGSEGLRTSGLFVSNRDINDSFILGHPFNGVAGSLGVGSLQPLLGDRRGALTVVYSGGFF